MYDILTLNKIAKCGLEKLGDNFAVSDANETPDAIILRSFSMHEMELPEKLKAVARAGAGVNNIPIDKCTERGIVVFNTPGANANAVKELVVAGLLLASRNIIGGIEWVKTLNSADGDIGKMVEKGKSNFVGPELKGKTLGVIGLGAIGVMVANAATHLGMEVIGYDPYLTVEHAWRMSGNVKHVTDLKEIYDKADYITVHVPFNDSTKGMLNKETFMQMKDGVRILNFSRGGLVNEDDISEALESGKVASYVVDFPSEKVLSMKNVVAIPHLGASTPESEDNCAIMASVQLKDFLENGNIINSVNFPNCEMAREGKVRVTITHKNIPNMLSQFSAIFAARGLNIVNMINKSKKENAYTIMDIEGDVGSDVANEIKAIEGVLGARVIA